MTPISRDEIFEFVEKKYKAKPEYLWKRSPGHAVLRNNENNKWFGIIMEVRGDKLGLKDHEKHEALNVKCDPFLIDVLLTKEGFKPAYHMNKRNWITILLDGSVEQEEIFNLINLSYDLTSKKK